MQTKYTGFSVLMARQFVHVSKTEILSTVSMCNNQQHNENLLYVKRLPLNLGTGERTTPQISPNKSKSNFLGKFFVEGGIFQSVSVTSRLLER